MRTAMIRFAYFCIIMTFIMIDLAVIRTPWYLLGSTFFGYLAGYLQREYMIPVTGKWYDGKDLQ
jgi:hypothetical protein